MTPPTSPSPPTALPALADRDRAHALDAAAAALAHPKGRVHPDGRASPDGLNPDGLNPDGPSPRPDDTLGGLSLQQLCGQLIVGGFEGPTLPAPMVDALRAGHRAGVILFARNIASAQALHALTSELAALRVQPSPFVSIDQEGGRVQRLGPPVLPLPPMRRLGELGDAALARRVGAELGRQLAALGITVDFAPVLDVDSNPLNPVIGDRSFGADPALVARLGAALAEGLQSVGVMACGKHFPGHGDTSVDSHLDLPYVRHPEERLRAVELAPFAATARGLGSLMSAHVVYDALDAERPATLSPRIATHLLREQLGFEGVLFSDDLEMRALADRQSVEASAVAAIEAGCDVLLICRSFDRQQRAHRALVEAAERSSDFLQRCRQAAARARAARLRYPLRPAASLGELEEQLATPEASALATELARLGQGPVR